MRGTSWNSPAARRGVSLLEVLISIGVTSIGLLGVMSLIPLAGAQARKGQISERATVIGLAGVGEINARGMANPNNWRTATTPATPVSMMLDPQNNSPGLRSVCIDPRRVSFDSSTSFPSLSSTESFPSGFPVISMTRVSLPGLNNSSIMTKELADLVFQSQDDLTLSLPADRSMPAYQVMSPADTADNPAASADFTRRQFDGTMSWMVTLVPKANATDSYNRDLYTASIVVFHTRPFDEGAERAASVEFHSAGIAGGDVTLTQANTVTDASGNVIPMDVRTGQWILLAGRQTSISPITQSYPYFRWYRVIAASSLDTTTNSQDVTLQGPDWFNDTTTDQFETQAIIMPGVVGVYEKTVRLETSSLWSN